MLYFKFTFFIGIQRISIDILARRFTIDKRRFFERRISFIAHRYSHTVAVILPSLSFLSSLFYNFFGKSVVSPFFSDVQDLFTGCLLSVRNFIGIRKALFAHECNSFRNASFVQLLHFKEIKFRIFFSQRRKHIRQNR